MSLPVKCKESWANRDTVDIKKALERWHPLALSQGALLGSLAEPSLGKKSNFIFISSCKFLVSLNAENLPWGNHLITQGRPGNQALWPTHSTCFTGEQLRGHCEVRVTWETWEQEGEWHFTLCSRNTDSVSVSRMKQPWKRWRLTRRGLNVSLLPPSNPCPSLQKSCSVPQHIARKQWRKK